MKYKKLKIIGLYNSKEPLEEINLTEDIKAIIPVVPFHFGFICEEGENTLTIILQSHIHIKGNFYYGEIRKKDFTLESNGEEILIKPSESLELERY